MNLVFQNSLAITKKHTELGISTPQCAAQTLICFLFSWRRISCCNWDAQGSEWGRCLVLRTAPGELAAAAGNAFLRFLQPRGWIRALCAFPPAPVRSGKHYCWVGKGSQGRGDKSVQAGRAYCYHRLSRHPTVFDNVLSIKRTECCHHIDVRNRNIRQGNRRRGNQRE